MKKLLFIVACLFFCGMSQAQDFDGPRFSVRLGAGFPGAGPERFVTGINPNHFGIQGIYDDYFSDTKAIPALTAECLYRMNDWFCFGVETVYSSYSNQRYDGITDKVKEERNGQIFIVMPTAHVNYYQKDALALYMGIAVGAGYYSGFDNMWEKLMFEVQFIPIGIEYGRRVFCFAEGCLGTAVNWAHAGIGFRF